MKRIKLCMMWTAEWTVALSICVMWLSARMLIRVIDWREASTSHDKPADVLADDRSSIA